MTKLNPLKFALSSELTLVDILTAWKEFVTRLLNLQLTMTKDNKLTKVKFTTIEVTKITNFFLLKYLATSFSSELAC